MIDTQPPNDSHDKLLIAGITGIISLAIGIIVERFKNRLTVLKYSISFQSLATSSKTDHWGRIEVFHDGRITNHLNFITIEVENSSNTDLQDLCLDISCDSNSQFLGWQAFYNEGGTIIALEQRYYNYYIDVLERNQRAVDENSHIPNYLNPKPLSDEVNYIQTNKKFYLPVFNRKTKITVNLLVENYNAVIPTINTNILHKSVKLIKTEDSEAELKRVGIWSVVIAYLIFFSGISILLNHFSDNMKPVIYTGILAFLYGGVGLGIVLLFKLFKRLFS